MPDRSAGERITRDRRTSRVAGTKFVPPPLPSIYAAQSTLVHHVGTCLRRATATVIRAPAGSGKTTLARAVVDSLDLPWSWATLDEWDDGSRLLELLHGSLARVGIDLGGLRQLVAGTSTAFSARDAATIVVNDLLESTVTPVVVVLDDAHRLTAQADAVALLAELLALSPPSLHLLLTSRRPLPMPLARLEAIGRIVQIEPDSLRVDVEQASRILAKMDASVSQRDLERLVDRTGGWVTGIRLVAGGDDGAGPSSDAVGRYVQEELFTSLLDEDVQTLTDLAVLRRIRPGQVSALTGRTDAEHWLQGIVAQLPVLVSTLDDGTVQFHDLLRDALLKELETDEDRFVCSHVAAADVVEDWQEELHHLVAARSFERAVDLIEDRSRAVFPRPGPVAQIRRLMDQVPREIWEGRRWMRVIDGVALTHRADYAAAREILRTVLSDLDDADVLTRWAAQRFLQRGGDDPIARTQQLQLLEGEPGFDVLGAEILAEHDMSLAHGAALAGRWNEVSTRHAAAIRTVITSSEVAAAEVVSNNTSPFVALSDGGVERIDGFVEWLDRRLDGTSALLTVGRDIHRAFSAFVRGDLARAEVHAAAVGDRAVGLHLPYLRAQVDWVRVCAMTVRATCSPPWICWRLAAEPTGARSQNRLRSRGSHRWPGCGGSRGTTRSSGRWCEAAPRSAWRWVPMPR